MNFGTDCGKDFFYGKIIFCGTRLLKKSILIEKYYVL